MNEPIFLRPEGRALFPNGLLSAWVEGYPRQETRKAYLQTFRSFAEHIGAQDAETAARRLLSNYGQAYALAVDFRRALCDKKKAAATVNRALCAMRSFVTWARKCGLILWHLEVESLKVEPMRDTRGPGESGVRRMMALLEGKKDARSVRNLAILHLLYDLALRRGEVIGLDVEHVDLEGKGIWVLGKMRTQRERITLPPETCAALADWIKFRGTGPGALFMGFWKGGRDLRWGGRLTDSGLAQMVVALGKQVGLKVRPHGLRHAAITEALELTGGNVRAVQKFSRHKDLRVLCVYDDNRQDMGGEVARLVAKGRPK